MTEAAPGQDRLAENELAAAGPVGAIWWLGWGLAVLLPLCRALLTHDPMPHWAGDPSTNYVPLTGIGPGLWAMTDAGIVAGVGLVLLAVGLRGGRVPWGSVALWGAGSIGVLAHGLSGPIGVEHAARATPWVSAAALLIAGRAVASSERSGTLGLRLAAALAFGIVVMLAAKGALQVVVEHPATVANYRLTEQTQLAAQGWSPGSPQQRAFERRLLQSEASGWFGLSNVFGSVAAASLGAWLAIGVMAVRRRSEFRVPWRYLGVAYAVGVGAAIGALAMSRSKGAFGSLAVAGAVAFGVSIAAARLARRRPGLPAPGQLAGRLPAAAGPIVIALVSLGVLLRGLIGERLDELSVLFRAHYIEAALRMWASRPLLGVGPDSFQEVYARAKPPENPETVLSPHSVLFDWTATLGLFGLAWAALLGRTAGLIGLGLRRTPVNAAPEIESPADAGPPLGDEIKLMVLLACVTMFAAAMRETSVATLEAGIARIAGLAGWCVAASAVLLVARGSVDGAHAVRAGLAVAGLVLIGHSQIEMTPVLAGSAPLWGLMLGLAATGGAGQGSRAGAAPRAAPDPAVDGVGGARRNARHRVAAMSAGAAMLIGAGALGAFAAWPLARWEGALSRAADAVRPVGEATRNLTTARALAATGDPANARAAQALAAGATELAQAFLGGADLETPEALAQALDAARVEALRLARPDLERAVAVRPGDRSTARALSATLLSLAAAAEGPAERRELAVEALDVAERAAAARPGSSAAQLRILTTIEAGRSVLNDPAWRAGEGLAAGERAARLDPYDPWVAWRLARLAASIGADDLAARWAADALARNEFKRLDPETGLTSGQRAALRELAAGGR